MARTRWHRWQSAPTAHRSAPTALTPPPSLAARCSRCDFATLRQVLVHPVGSWESVVITVTTLLPPGRWVSCDAKQA